METENLWIEFVGGENDGQWFSVRLGAIKYSIPLSMVGLAETYIITTIPTGRRIAVEETLFGKGEYL